MRTSRSAAEILRMGRSTEAVATNASPLRELIDVDRTISLHGTVLGWN
jgi:hypothetical protein